MWRIVLIFMRDGPIFWRQKMRSVNEKNLENLSLKQIAKPLKKKSLLLLLYCAA